MDQSSPTPIPTTDVPQARRRPITPRRLITWAAASCLLLATSGAVRGWQDQRFGTAIQQAAACPISLEDLPRALGKWKAVPASDRELDEMTLRIAGGTDYVVRTYYDELTGVNLDLLVLFGSPDRVAGHMPEVCFPAFGFKADGPTTLRLIEADGLQALFRSSVYRKVHDRQEVYSSLRQGGRWSPDVVGNRRTLARGPGVFKIQVQRHVGDSERRDEGNPTEEFLGQLLLELEGDLGRTTSP